MYRRPPSSPLFPYPTLSLSAPGGGVGLKRPGAACTAELSRLRKQKQTAYNMIEDNPRLKDLLACELDAWVENDPYLSPREKQALRNQRLSQEEKTIMR